MWIKRNRIRRTNIIKNGFPFFRLRKNFISIEVYLRILLKSFFSTVKSYLMQPDFNTVSVSWHHERNYSLVVQIMNRLFFFHLLISPQSGKHDLMFLLIPVYLSLFGLGHISIVILFPFSFSIKQKSNFLKFKLYTPFIFNRRVV